MVAMVGMAVGVAGCHGRSVAARREGDRATAEAEAKAQSATLTSAELDAADSAGAGRSDTETDTTAAFRLEQSDYRGRLQVALDQLDGAVQRSRSGRADAASRGARELRARRALLKADLDALGRSTEQDWATLRTKLERDLEQGPQ